MPSDDDCSFVLDIEDGLKWFDVLGCFVWKGKVVQEYTGLEQCVFDDLFIMGLRQEETR